MYSASTRRLLSGEIFSTNCALQSNSLTATKPSSLGSTLVGAEGTGHSPLRMWIMRTPKAKQSILAS